MFKKEELLEFVAWMIFRDKPKGLPGWLHYRVLCDYIRDEVKRGNVTYQDLGFRNELQLLRLELSCAKESARVWRDSLVEHSLRHALQVRMKELNGGKVDRHESDQMHEFFDDEVDLKQAA